ncbi:single-strand selective monofunctional uracil DNA glycosylase isoform X2 [Nilaparvata lugens]|uniref:single-strand selective monofunctional uracil DNA glycosylase isoform X2 n=2 Tax=Nilaparvata lugens TaxID=108931 RepID=UPI00193D4D99|nr:single-strand selective monofunctional uracil DNA glycosylase isoform X2 [Nilaparvata lugens]
MYLSNNSNSSISISNTVKDNNSSIADEFLRLENELVNRLTDFNTTLLLRSTVEYIYNPLEYAYDVHKNFVHKYCSSSKKILFLGMNPGPWGMMQTGVPFGDVISVKKWLKITGVIRKPLKEHRLRPVSGFDCKRIEVSGKRFWAFAQQLSHGNPALFFSNCFVHNYFPLVLMTESGKNVTPADLKPAEKKELESVCDESLCSVIDLLQIEVIIAIGRYTEKRVNAALKKTPKNVHVVYIMHPSPRNPKSNQEWMPNVINCLSENGLLNYFQETKTW